MRACLSFALGFWLLSGAVAPAQAQPNREYEKAIERAVTAYNDGDYEESTRQFQRAHDLSPNARTFRGIGMSEFELGHHDRAAEALKAALASEVAPLAGDLRKDTERLLREALARVGRVRLKIQPESSEIALDGAPRKVEDDRILLVTPGPHMLELSAPGYDSARQPINAEAGRVFDLKLALTPLAGNSGPSDAERTDGRRWYKSPWLWTSVGLVVVAGAVVGGLAAAGKFDRDSGDADSGTTDTTLYVPALRVP